ncbi:hypothetical protein B0H66DRAFT_569253 [Apodospora peruviana]|uniref:Uncharacterized protein n=1 Tax=Apodospora peruviana TaxID=516989 RepID=A0AAE0HUU1_9PEZI|nr:hypothetical protein B0H66DRAFT_569253 [Apodospora peruviana]
MATCPVRFEFHCDEASEELNLVVYEQTQAAQKDAEYVSRFLAAIQLILKEHQADCRAASKPFCGNCGSPSAGILQTPMSWLHNVQDPFVVIWVNHICGKAECETQMRKSVQNMMAEVGAGVQGGGLYCARQVPGIYPAKSVERRKGL